MGYGLLLIGYFISFAMSLAESYFFADIIGGVIIIYSFNKLSFYGEKFKKAVLPAITYCLLCLFGAALFLIGYDGTFGILIANIIKCVSILVMHIYMFLAISVMAKEADDFKISNRCHRNTTIISVYYGMYIVFLLTQQFFDNILYSYFNLILYIYGIVCILLNMLLIHSAYSRFFVIGERIEEPKQSRIPLINFIRKKFYESQKKAAEENYRMIKEAQDYALENSGKQKEKKKRKK